LDLVVDANVLFSILVKDSKTAEIAFLDELHLFAPEFIFEEYEKYARVLAEKTDRPPENFARIFSILKTRIRVIPAEEIAPFTERAKKISPDPKDAAYLALALRLRADIWSNDKRLSNQKSVRIWRTEELAALLEKR